MSIQRTFFNWATSGLPYDRAPWESCSPNLLALLEFVVEEWGGYSLGCEGDRPIRQGVAQSSHSFGAALDWRYTPVRPGDTNVTRQEAVRILTWVIDNSAELHIDAIHDYAGDRIWRAGRTANASDAQTSWWKKQNGAGSGMGESWATYFHFETSRDGWADSTPIPLRPGVVLPNGATPPQPPNPQPPPEDEDMLINNDILDDIDSAPPVAAMNAPANADTSRWFQASVIAAMFKSLTGSKTYTQAAAEKLNALLKD